MATRTGDGPAPVADEPEFDHPYVTVDVVLLTVRAEQLAVLVTRRDHAPAGFVLPGAFVKMAEDVSQTAARVIHDKVGLLEVPEFLALRPFGAVDRDPRRRVITLPHLALVDRDRLHRATRAAAPDVTFAEVRLVESQLTITIDGQTERLVFDHEAILQAAVNEARRLIRLDDPRIHAQLLPETFTLRQLQHVHEAVLGEPVNRDSFRRRVLTSERLEKTSQYEQAVEHRPAQLYRWRTR